MKIFILTTILCISLIGNIFANDSTNTEVTKETIYKDVKEALVQMGGALKVGAEHVYGILVRQQIANSIIEVIIYIVFSIAVIILLKKGTDLMDRQKEEGTKAVNDDTIGWYMIPGVIIGIVLLVYFFCTINSTITGFVNPEYGAIKEIMEMIK